MAERGTRKAFWLAHIERAREQGVTLKAYAQAHELSLHQLYAHSSAQREGAQAPRTDSAPSTANSAPRWLPVQLKRESSEAAIRVRLASGVTIELARDVSPEHWRVLLEQVVRG
jgi:hypothetical protein